METEDVDSSFVLNGDPSIPLFPLISGGSTPDHTTTFYSSVFSYATPVTTAPTTLLTTFNSVDLLTPSLLSYYNNNLLTSPPPPPPQALNSNFLNEDGNYYYTPPASEQLGFGNSVVAPPQLIPPHESTKPYDFFSPVPQPVESTQPCDFFYSVQDGSTTTHCVLKDTQTLESLLENLSKKRKRLASSASLLTRQRITERVKCLRELMPWVTTKMDTATVLDEAYKYIMILQEQIRASVQSRPAPNSFDHHSHNCPYANDPYNFVNGANVGGGGVLCFWGGCFK